MKQKFSVLLLRPDYISDSAGFGHDTYFAHVYAKTARLAVAAARRQVTVADGRTLKEGQDYYVLLVLFGHHEDVAPRDT